MFNFILAIKTQYYDYLLNLIFMITKRIFAPILWLEEKETEASILLFSHRRPPYRNEQEHLKPDKVFTQCPCLPHTTFAKQKSSTRI